jgi:SAM-dependent methyltransferase
MADLMRRFEEMYRRDARFIRPWLVEWRYQKKRRVLGKQYEGGLPSDFFAYHGPDDLVKWMRWFENMAYPDFLGKEKTGTLVQASLKTDTRILQQLGLESPSGACLEHIALNNAHDYLLPRATPAPARRAIKKVLDFGAGYGRQAALWGSTEPDRQYVAMDATPNAYCLQHLYFSQTGLPFREYWDTENLDIQAELGKIVHLPTWRYDLLPDNHFDLVMCVQVLPELSSKLVREMIAQFRRVLKPGGMLYLRDNAEIWKPAGKMNVDAYLASQGFSLEYKPHLVNNRDLHGVVRCWRKNDPEVVDIWNSRPERGLKSTIMDIDFRLGGILSRMFKRLKGA